MIRAQCEPAMGRYPERPCPAYVYEVWRTVNTMTSAIVDIKISRSLSPDMRILRLFSVAMEMGLHPGFRPTHWHR